MQYRRITAKKGIQINNFLDFFIWMVLFGFIVPVYIQLKTNLEPIFFVALYVANAFFLYLFLHKRECYDVNCEELDEYMCEYYGLKAKK